MCAGRPEQMDWGLDESWYNWCFGVPGENDNGRRVVEFCAERGMCVCNIYFRHNSFISTQGWQETKMEYR